MSWVYEITLECGHSFGHRDAKAEPFSTPYTVGDYTACTFCGGKERRVVKTTGRG